MFWVFLPVVYIRPVPPTDTVQLSSLRLANKGCRAGLSVHTLQHNLEHSDADDKEAGKKLFFKAGP